MTKTAREYAFDARDAGRDWLEACAESLLARKAAGETINEAWLATVLKAIPTTQAYPLTYRTDR